MLHLFQDENLNRCSISADSRIENSGTEDSSDDENLDMKDNGYHDAENEVDPETDDDPERVHSGKLSESSGYAGSDLYDYKVLSLLPLPAHTRKSKRAEKHGCLNTFEHRDVFLHICMCIRICIFTERYPLSQNIF